MKKLIFYLKAYFQSPPMGDGYNSEFEYSRYLVVEGMLLWHQYIVTSDHIVYNCFRHPLGGNLIPEKGWVFTKTKDYGSGVEFLDRLGPLLKTSGLLRSKPNDEYVLRSGEFIYIKYSIESIRANNSWSHVKLFNYFINGYYTPGTRKNKEFTQLVEVIKFMFYESITK